MGISSVPEVASELLRKHKGLQRNAEAEAWEQQSGFDPRSEYYTFWRDVAIAISEGKEYPPVERQEFKYPTPAYRETKAA